MNHRQRHPNPVPGCFGCHALSVSFNQSPEAARIDRKEAALSADLAAYKRLRDDGLRPRGIDGCRELEGKVRDQFEIDLGRYVPPSEQSRVEEGFGVCREMGLLT